MQKSQDLRIELALALGSLGIAAILFAAAGAQSDEFIRATLLHAAAAFFELTLGVVVVEIYLRAADGRRRKERHRDMQRLEATVLEPATEYPIGVFLREFRKDGARELVGGMVELDSILAAHRESPASASMEAQKTIARWYIAKSGSYERLLREIEELFKELIPVLSSLDRDINATNEDNLLPTSLLFLGSIQARVAIKRLLGTPHASSSRTQQRICKYFLDSYLYVDQVRGGLERIRRSAP